MAITRLVTERLRTAMDADVVSLFILQDQVDGRVLTPIASAGEMTLPADLVVPADGAGRLEQVLVHRRPLVIDDLPPEVQVGPAVVPTLGVRSIVLVPISGEDGVTGMLVVASLRPRRFSSLEVDRVMAIAGQTGTALTNARLLATSRRWSEHLEGIEALSRQLNRSRDIVGVGETVAEKIGDIIDYDGLRFYVLQPDGETLDAIALRSRVEYYANETPELVVLRLGEGLGGTIALARQAEIVPDVLADPRMQDIAGSDDIDESMIVIPLVFEERVLGVIELSRLGCDAFEPDDLRLMQILGAQAAVALENAARHEELERRSQRLEHQLESERLLLGVTERLLQTREIDATFEAIAETLETVVPYDTLTIYRVDQAAGLLVPVLARDQFADEILKAKLPLGAGITGSVVQRGEAECINDAGRDPRVVNVPGTPDDDYESIIVAPLHGPNGVMGALNLYRIGRDFEQGELDLAKLYANHAAIALDNAILYGQLREAARHDPLTGLLHHGVFQDELNERVNAGPVAVLMIDLDDFRSYNNQFGHQAGDRLLRRIADGLRRSVRTGDLVCRYGGDEFALILPGTDEAGASAVARKVLRRFAELRSRSGDSELRVGASIGTAAFPQDAKDARDLVSIADTALFVAKHFGKGRAVAAGDLPTHVREMRTRLEEDVRAAQELAGARSRRRPRRRLARPAAARAPPTAGARPRPAERRGRRPVRPLRAGLWPRPGDDRGRRRGRPDHRHRTPGRGLGRRGHRRRDDRLAPGHRRQPAGALPRARRGDRHRPTSPRALGWRRLPRRAARRVDLAPGPPVCGRGSVSLADRRRASLGAPVIDRGAGPAAP